MGQVTQAVGNAASATSGTGRSLQALPDSGVWPCTGALVLLPLPRGSASINSARKQDSEAGAAMHWHLSAQFESLPALLPQNSLLLSLLHTSVQVQGPCLIPVSSRWGGNDSEEVWKAGNGLFPCITKEEEVYTVLSVCASATGKNPLPSAWILRRRPSAGWATGCM